MQIKIMQPLWYHPTSVLLIDDDKKVLKSLGKEIDPNFPFTAFTNPKEALEYLKKHIIPLETLSQATLSDIEPSEIRHLSTENVAIDFTPLHAHLDKPTRFSYFVTVIVDKVMKEMDGLDFCRMVRQLGLPVKLILLTGNAGAEEAVSAFNDQIIDAFIQKAAPDMMEQINQQLKVLAFQAFCDNSTQLLGPILNRLPLLNNEAFADFLKLVCHEHEIAEYYIIDSSCSCLLITEKGVVKTLLIKSSHDFKNAYDIALNDSSTEARVLEALKNREAFPFAEIGDSYFNFDVAKWKNVMVPMKKHPELDCYYGITDQSKTVLSFDHFINGIWTPKIN